MRVQLIINQFCIVLGKKKEQNDQASKIRNHNNEERKFDTFKSYSYSFFHLIQIDENKCRKI